MQYKDLYALFRGEPEARKYFDALPGYVQEQIRTRPGGVNSMASLQDYADNLLRGNDSKEERTMAKKGMKRPGSGSQGAQNQNAAQNSANAQNCVGKDSKNKSNPNQTF